jgi:hypothetical protein
MAIYRKTRDEDGKRVRQSDFSCYPIGLTSAVYNDTLAQMIVDSWVDTNFRNGLLNNPQTVKSLLAARGLHLQNPVMIEEETYYQDYEMQNDNEIVFVLPQKPDCPPGQPLLETARLLMAITPNGI